MNDNAEIRAVISYKLFGKGGLMMVSLSGKAVLLSDKKPQGKLSTPKQKKAQQRTQSAPESPQHRSIAHSSIYSLCSEGFLNIEVMSWHNTTEGVKLLRVCERFSSNS